MEKNHQDEQQLLELKFTQVQGIRYYSLSYDHIYLVSTLLLIIWIYRRRLQELQREQFNNLERHLMKQQKQMQEHHRLELQQYKKSNQVNIISRWSRDDYRTRLVSYHYSNYLPIYIGPIRYSTVIARTEKRTAATNATTRTESNANQASSSSRTNENCTPRSKVYHL